MTRLWTCSPVATRIGAIARAIGAWPNTSSGLVGPSIQYGLNRPSTCIASIASPTSHLVRVHHQVPLGTDLLPQQRGTAPVVR